MKRTPEEQAEELLNYLPKKDCFEKLCEALEADDQEEIVSKYLRLPLETTDQSSDSHTAASSSKPTEVRVSPDNSSNSTSEVTDSAVSATPNVKSTISVIRIKEPDNNHLCIEYQNPESPQKRIRLDDQLSNGAGVQEQDGTRYVHKHFIAQETEPPSSHNSLAVVSVVNPQSLAHVAQNPNISDPVRYMAAYRQQQSSHGFTAQLCLTDQSKIPSSSPLCSTPDSNGNSSPRLTLRETFHPDLTVSGSPSVSQPVQPHQAR